MKKSLLVTKISTAFLVALSFQQSQAMYGDVQPSVPDSVCQLVLYKPNKDVKAICTGSLISPTEIATAAHCVTDLLFKSSNSTLVAKCGYRSVTPEEMVIQNTLKGTPFYKTGVNFAETLEVAEAHIDQSGFFGGSVPNDLALVVLKTPSQLQFMPVAEESEIQEAAARSTATEPSFKFCMSSGFGINADGTAGLPFSARFDGIFYANKAWEQYSGTPKVKDEELELFLKSELAKDPVKEFTKFLVQHKYIPNILEAGDSGGPLMCLVNDQWKVFGVVNGHTLEYNTLGSAKLTTSWGPYLKKQILKRIR